MIYLKRLVWLLFAIILTLIIGAFWLTYSTPGLKLILLSSQMILAEHDVQLHYQQVTGNLTNLKLERMTLSTANDNIQVTQLHVNWTPAQLFHGTLHIKQLTAEKLTYQKQTHQKIDTAKLKLPKLSLPPLAIQVEQLHIMQTTFNQHQLGTTTAHGALNEHGLKLKAILKGKEAQLTLQTSIEKNLTAPLIIALNGTVIGNHIALNSTGTRAHYQLTAKWQPTNKKRDSLFELTATGTSHAIASQQLYVRNTTGTLEGHFDVNWSDHVNWHIQIKGNNLNLATLDPRLPKHSNLQLTTDAENHQQVFILQLKSQKNHLALTVNGTIHHDQWHGKVSQLDLTVAKKQWQLRQPTALLIGKHQIKLKKFCLTSDNSYACADLRFIGQNIHSDLTFSIADISPLQDLLPNDFYQSHGQLTGKIQFNKNGQQQQLSGNIDLQHGSTLLLPFGLYLQKITIHGKINKKNALALAGRLRSGSGILQAKGTLSLKPNPMLQLQLKGDQVTLMHLPQADLIASPDVKLAIQHQQTQISGNILINRANINGNIIRQQTGTGSDIVFQSAHKTQSKGHQHNLSYNLHLTLGKQVKFEGFGISALLGGQLDIYNQAGQPTPFADGILRSTSGYYTAYGKHFKLESARLSFSQTPLDNPAIEATARYVMPPNTSTEALNKNLNLGVHVGGTLSNLTLTLFSVPAMSQENILSYIVLGTPLDQTKNSDKLSLSQAAAFFALNGGSTSVLNQIRQQLGLNQLTLGNIEAADNTDTLEEADNHTPDNSTAIFIGKSISPRLSVSYGLGLFNNEQAFYTHLTLDRHWSLQTDTSAFDKGVDLIYKI